MKSFIIKYSTESGKVGTITLREENKDKVKDKFIAWVYEKQFNEIVEITSIIEKGE